MSRVNALQEMVLREKIRKARNELESSCEEGMMEVLVQLEEKLISTTIESSTSFDSFTDNYLKGLHTGALMMIKYYVGVIANLLAKKSIVIL